MSLFDKVKGIPETLKAVGKMEAYQQMNGFLKEHEDLLEKHKSLKADLEARNKELDITKRLVFQEDAFKDSVYWYEGRPFCPKCWHKDKEVVRVQEGKVVSKGETEVFYRCEVCDTPF